nr:hypothetical protein [Methylobacterium sp. ZNC0032]
MFELLKIRRARRLAQATLDPFLRGVPGGDGLQAGDWLHPQIIGFLATLVTLVAQRACGPMRSHALAAVQADVLNGVTGIGPELIGEEICLWSSRDDPAFAAGVGGAAAFLEAMSGQAGDPDGGAAADPVLVSLWDEHVGHLLARARDRP